MWGAGDEQDVSCSWVSLRMTTPTSGSGREVSESLKVRTEKQSSVKAFLVTRQGFLLKKKDMSYYSLQFLNYSKYIKTYMALNQVKPSGPDPTFKSTYSFVVLPRETPATSSHSQRQEISKGFSNTIYLMHQIKSPYPPYNVLVSLLYLVIRLTRIWT